MIHIFGIDPGLDGAVAVLRMPGLTLLDVWSMPTLTYKVGKATRRRVNADELRNQLLGWITWPGEKLVMLEQVNAMPKQGVTSMFSFGRALGVAEGVVAGLALPRQWTLPQEWQRAVGVGKKANSQQIATERFPNSAQLFARKADDGKADAALIALFASMKTKPLTDGGAHAGATLGDDPGATV